MLIHRAQTVFSASVASVAQIVPPDFVIIVETFGPRLDSNGYAEVLNKLKKS